MFSIADVYIQVRIYKEDVELLRQGKTLESLTEGGMITGECDEEGKEILQPLYLQLRLVKETEFEVEPVSEQLWLDLRDRDRGNPLYNRPIPDRRIAYANGYVINLTEEYLERVLNGAIWATRGVGNFLQFDRMEMLYQDTNGNKASERRNRLHHRNFESSK